MLLDDDASTTALLDPSSVHANIINLIADDAVAPHPLEMFCNNAKVIICQMMMPNCCGDGRVYVTMIDLIIMGPLRPDNKSRRRPAIDSQQQRPKAIVYTCVSRPLDVIHCNIDRSERLDRVVLKKWRFSPDITPSIFTFFCN